MTECPNDYWLPFRRVNARGSAQGRLPPAFLVGGLGEVQPTDLSTTKTKQGKADRASRKAGGSLPYPLPRALILRNGNH